MALFSGRRAPNEKHERVLPLLCCLFLRYDSTVVFFQYSDSHELLVSFSLVAGHLSVAKYLASIDPSVFVESEDNSTSFYAACINGFLEVSVVSSQNSIGNSLLTCNLSGCQVVSREQCGYSAHQ